MKPLVLTILLVLAYLLHQDFWFWGKAHPLMLGFLPIGLFYHACYTLACAALMMVLVRRCWPFPHEDSSVPTTVSEDEVH
jgi:hypothetical protein